MMDYTYEAAVSYINDIPKFAAKNTIEDTQYLLSKIYDSNSTRIIHVAGTNGKGSVCAFVDSILEVAGLRVGLFTSPHLVTMNERIKVNGQDISNEDFLRAFIFVLELVKKEGANHPSFFEYLFLMAMYHFGQLKLDYIILETGLGGRKDATNSVPNKALSVITRIGLDHTEYLGDTLESIAGEKAGIIKDNVPVAFWNSENETTRVFEKISKDKNSTCYSIKMGDIFVNSHTAQSIDFSIRCGYYNYDSLSIRMLGKYQVENASLAILAVNVLKDERITKEHIKTGIFIAKWPGRMERLKSGVYIDGAHNADGIAAFIDAVASMPINEGERRSLLFSVVSDKAYDDMVKMLCESCLFDRVYLCQLDSSRGLKIGEIEGLFKKYSDVSVRSFRSAKEAYEAASSEMDKQESLYIAGSLYLVGEIKELVR